MEAIVYRKYGPPSVLHFAEVKAPEPKANELLIKIHASTVTSGTIWIRKGKYPGSWVLSFFIRLFFGISRPKHPIIGFEFSGIVEKTGDEVTSFKAGDKVYGTTTGLSAGAYASYICVPEKWKLGVVALKPAELSFNEAAALPVGSMTALQLLTKAKIKKGKSVLVYGASGSVGTYAVQIAKYFGTEVTAVAGTNSRDLAKSIGADYTISYQTIDIALYKNCFDVVIDAVGKLPAAVLKSMMKKGGHFASVKSMTNEKTDYLEFLHGLVRQGRLHPVLDRIYSWREIVQAHEYVETGRKKGNVVIEIIKSEENYGKAMPQ